MCDYRIENQPVEHLVMDLPNGDTLSVQRWSHDRLDIETDEQYAQRHYDEARKVGLGGLR